MVWGWVERRKTWAETLRCPFDPNIAGQVHQLSGVTQFIGWRSRCHFLEYQVVALSVGSGHHLIALPRRVVFVAPGRFLFPLEIQPTVSHHPQPDICRHRVHPATDEGRVVDALKYQCVLDVARCRLHHQLPQNQHVSRCGQRDRLVGVEHPGLASGDRETFGVILVGADHDLGETRCPPADRCGRLMIVRGGG